MTVSTVRSPLARAALVVLSLFWAAAAWFVLLQGGFHATHKYSRASTFVGGGGGLLMAAIFFLLATIAALAVLQSVGARRWTQVLAALLFLVPPALFVLVG